MNSKKSRLERKKFSEWVQKANVAVKTCNATNDKLTGYVNDAQDEPDGEQM